MISYFAKTDIGKRRRLNQDYIYARPNKISSFPNLFILADGMGGHRAGDYASKFLVEELKKTIEESEKSFSPMVLDEAINNINKKIYKLSKDHEELNGMGSTLVLSVIDDKDLFVANVGDSRAYHIHNGNIKQITKDHSYVAEMIRKGLMTRGSDEYYKYRNVITRAVGAAPSVRIDFFELTLEDGDYLLMCSDGLSNMIDDESILNIVKAEGDCEKKVDSLIDLANINGGRDNIAVILVKYNSEEVK